MLHVDSESEEEKLPQDRWYWGWYGIFLALLGISPFVPAAFGIPCGVIGIGGLLIQMREGFKARIANIRQFRVSRAHLLAFMRVAAVMMLVVLGVKTISLIFEINTAFETYIVPRTISEEQGSELRDYLSRREPFSVTVKVNSVNDTEAMEYASELFNALRQTNWDINPPAHNGPEYQKLPAPSPKANDVDANGLPLYKTYNAYLDARDAWLEGEIDRKIAEQTYGGNGGLCLNVQTAGAATNPDPKHPTPDAILLEALRYAKIEVNCSGGGPSTNGKYVVSLVVNHRPWKILKHSWLMPYIGRFQEWLAK
jgi:hypothetical protein